MKSLQIIYVPYDINNFPNQTEDTSTKRDNSPDRNSSIKNSFYSSHKIIHIDLEDVTQIDDKICHFIKIIEIWKRNILTSWQTYYRISRSIGAGLSGKFFMDALLSIDYAQQIFNMDKCINLLQELKLLINKLKKEFTLNDILSISRNVNERVERVKYLLLGENSVPNECQSKGPESSATAINPVTSKPVDFNVNHMIKTSEVGSRTPVLGDNEHKYPLKDSLRHHVSSNHRDSSIRKSKVSSVQNSMRCGSKNSNEHLISNNFLHKKLELDVLKTIHEWRSQMNRLLSQFLQKVISAGEDSRS